MISKIIALEEHYADAELTGTFAGADATKAPAIRERLDDVGALRLKEMDQAGIALQVLSHNSPATQNLEAARAVPMSRRVNDRLHDVVRSQPTRFAAFAALPTDDPAAAADELERAVTALQFKGAMLHGRSRGEWLDHPRFLPIFERAAALDVPLYLHPSNPHPDVVRAYYADYAQDHPMLVRAAWGYTVETATQAIRLVLSSVFQRLPNLKIVLGHLGETLPFLLERIDESLSRNPKFGRSFRQEFCRHFYVTTSGNFSTPALLCSIMELGIDRVLFSVDWPYVQNDKGVAWMAKVPLSEEDKEKILFGNAKRLLRL
jgi:predicted TIM-barrel fold metal-dependent hydrolase